MKKTYGIRFAAPRVTYMCAENSDIGEAVEMAACNLYFRHHVKILDCNFHNRILWITLDIPEDQLPFNAGRRLSGIARYLLRTYPDKYRPLLSGARLFYYFLDED